MSKWLDAWTPNRTVAPATVRLIVAVQAAVVIGFWWASPFAVLPNPPEVARAFGKLWLEQGLSRELATSFILNLEALAASTVIALGLSYLTVFFLTSMVAVVEEIPKSQFDHARTLRMTEWRVVWEVVVLGTLGAAIEV